MRRYLAPVAGLFLLVAPLRAEPKPEIIVDGKKLPELLEQLRGKNPEDRARARKALAALSAESRSAVNAAVDAILADADRDPQAAVEALVALRGAAVPALTAALWDEKTRRWAVVTVALGRNGAAARPAVAPLTQALNDDLPAARSFAA